jgi:hypothetical protein
MRRVATSSDSNTGPGYYLIVTTLDSGLVFLASLRYLRVDPTKGGALLSLAILRFFARRLQDPKDQEAIIQASTLGWLATLYCCMKELRRGMVGRSWNMTIASLVMFVVWGRKAVPGR